MSALNPSKPANNRRADPGLVGATFFIVSESMFFLGLFLAYFYLRNASQTWPPAGVPPLSLGLPIINTLIMAASVVFMLLAVRGSAMGQRQLLEIGLGAAASLGVAFMVIQAFELASLGFGAYSNAYGSAFFFLMGFHVARVFAGVVFMVIVLTRAFMGHFTPDRRTAVQACAMYWYFIAAIWLIVFYVLYIVQ